MNFTRMYSQAAYEDQNSSADSSFSSQMDAEYTFPQQEEQSFAYYPPHQQFYPPYNARQALARPPTPEVSFRQPRYHIWSDAEVPQYNPLPEAAARPILEQLPSSQRGQLCSSSQAGRKRSWQEVNTAVLPAAKRIALPLANTAMPYQPEERRRVAEHHEERRCAVRQMEEQLEAKEIELDDLREQIELAEEALEEKDEEIEDLQTQLTYCSSTMACVLVIALVNMRLRQEGSAN